MKLLFDLTRIIAAVLLIVLVVKDESDSRLACVLVGYIIAGIFASSVHSD